MTLMTSEVGLLIASALPVWCQCYANALPWLYEGYAKDRQIEIEKETKTT